MDVKRIAFVGYNGVTALDLFGPLEVFDTARRHAAKAGIRYEVLVLTISGEAFSLEQGITVQAHGSLEAGLPIDTLLVPGGRGARDASTVAPLLCWLQHNAPAIRRVGSVCTGIYLLGKAGLLEGKRVTTHWRFAEDFGRQFPGVRVDSDFLFIRDDWVYTSAGVTAGIDLALALIEEDLGRDAALAVGRDLVVYLMRSGGQRQFSEPLQFQTRATDRFAGLSDWILQNLRHDISNQAMADRVHLSPRQFSRRFKAAFGLSPAEYVERLRLDEARRRLAYPNAAVDVIANALGYTSADAFRRAFSRHFGIAPRDYRRRFGMDSQPEERGQEPARAAVTRPGATQSARFRA